MYMHVRAERYWIRPGRLVTPYMPGVCGGWAVQHCLEASREELLTLQTHDTVALCERKTTNVTKYGEY